MESVFYVKGVLIQIAGQVRQLSWIKRTSSCPDAPMYGIPTVLHFPLASGI